MPIKLLALEAGFEVDSRLVDINRVVQEELDRPEQKRVPIKLLEDRSQFVNRENGPDLVAGRFRNDRRFFFERFRGPEPVELLQTLGDPIVRKKILQKEKAVFLETQCPLDGKRGVGPLALGCMDDRIDPVDRFGVIFLPGGINVSIKSGCHSLSLHRFLE
jgi:hypothetical protein